MNNQIKASPLSVQILEILWEHGKLSTKTIHESIQHSHPLAFTTVSTVLTRMEKKGLVKHSTIGRQYFYEALIEKESLQEKNLQLILDTFFEGKASHLMSFLLTSQHIESEELEEIKNMIETNKKKGDS